MHHTTGLHNNKNNGIEINKHNRLCACVCVGCVCLIVFTIVFVVCIGQERRTKTREMSSSAEIVNHAALETVGTYRECWRPNLG